MIISEKRLNDFFVRFPRFLEICRVLNQAEIPFMIAGSGCLFLLGNDRMPDDVDVFVPDALHDKADSLFGISSYEYRSEQERVRNSNPFGEHVYQLTSHLHLSVGGKEYGLGIVDEQLSQAMLVETESVSFRLFPPEDVLLIKALLQRGSEAGKHDIEDIRHFLECYREIDRGYLKHRIRALHAEERVAAFFE